MGDAVKFSIEGAVAVLAIDNPPVNALGQAVRQGLVEGIGKAEAEAGVKVVIILGEGRTFPAGADIREFGKPPVAPILPDVCNRIEDCTKPVIAVLHGTALGGGFEIALSAHYRLALPGARVGFPEVNLGLLPGAGGTQRMPRITGAAPALELMISGRPMDARDAYKLGLIDKLAQGSGPRAEGLAYAQEIVAAGKGPRRTRERTEGLADRAANEAALEATRQGLEVKARGLFAPFKIVEAVRAALTLPFAEGMARERALFLECMASPQREGLIHAFFAERRAAKVPETQKAGPRALAKVGVVGGGTMGAGITVALLDAGLLVIMIERDAENLAKGRANVEKVYGRLVSKGRMTPEQKGQVLTRYTGATDYAALSGTDLVIEAVFEEMAVKEAVFTELDRVMKPGAVLATNTSYLDVNEIAAVTKRPQDVLGLHFFSPANIMRLLEIVVPAQVSADVVATGFDLAKRLRKVAVRAGVSDGFIGNRILAVYRTAADYMMEDGASPYEIDAAIRDFGFPMGPFQVSDLAGGDIGWAVRKRKAATRDPRDRYVHIADRLCEHGWFGQKTGRGWYLYPDGARVGVPDPEVEAIIAEERKKAGVTPRRFSGGEIVARYMAAMINESSNVVADGTAQRPSDVDVTLLYGYAFPRWRGGPMKYADMTGLDKILADIEGFAKEDSRFWRPSVLLVDLARKGASFDSLNTE